MTEQPKDFDRPTRHGQLVGQAMTMMADRGREECPALPECCLTCAFRPGTIPNESAATLKIAFDAVMGIDDGHFFCHHGLKDGEPSKVCVGYAAALLAPFPFVKEVLMTLYDELGTLGEGAQLDRVREAFDRRLAKADPNREMDAYQMARAYARDHVMTKEGAT